MASVSVKDVAKLAGVSIGTVSNVLNHPDKVSEQTAKRVHDAIDKLGFVRNEAARQLRAGASRALGLVILDARNPFFTDLSRGAEDEAAAAGFSVILGNSGESGDRESAYLDLFEEQRLHGLLISPVGDVAARLRKLRERGIRSVLVDRVSDDSSFSSVSVDDVAGGRLAVTHLIEAGRRRIAFAGGPESLRQVADRLTGARLAVGETDASLEVLPTEALTVAEGNAVGAAVAARPAGQRPDAVFAANDLVAIGVLSALASAGIGVPGDMALVGYDDIDFARELTVPLSSVRQPAPKIGATAVRILLDETQDPSIAPRAVRYQPELVVRASSAVG
jgi:LacI family transcriptional regulator